MDRVENKRGKIYMCVCVCVCVCVYCQENGNKGAYLKEVFKIKFSRIL